MGAINNSDEVAKHIQSITNSKEYNDNIEKAVKYEAARKRLKKQFNEIIRSAKAGKRACDWFPIQTSKNIED